MRFSNHQLVLFPVDAAVSLDPDSLRQVLQGAGLLAADLGEGYYASGEAFPSRVCFLGCSPHIELEPQESAPFCYIQLPQDGEAKEFVLMRKAPRKTAVWVVIGNIHEAEAVPDTTLLGVLEKLSGCAWKYGYRR